MPYITTAERIGMKKGLLEDAKEMVLEALEDVVRAQGDREVLRRWHRLAIRAGSLEEFRREAGV